MSVFNWNQGSGDVLGRSKDSAGPPAPPPRDPTGINSVVLEHVVHSVGFNGDETSASETTSYMGVAGGKNSNSSNGAAWGEKQKKRRSPTVEAPPPRIVDVPFDSDDSSDSSSASFRDSLRRRFEPVRSMEGSENGRTTRHSPLRAVVNPTTVDGRNRCSNYENVEANDMSTNPGYYPGKPPLSTARSTARVISPVPLGVPSDYTSPNLASFYLHPPAHHNHQQHHHPPVVFPRHPSSRQEGSCISSVPAVRHSPSSENSRLNTAASPCPSKTGGSGRNTPTASGKNRAMTSSVPVTDRSSPSWKELESYQLDAGDSTDSDPIRRRSSSTGGRLPRSHRGSLPTGGPSWHHGPAPTCPSPCCPSPTMRYHHWHGTVPPPSPHHQPGWGYCGGGCASMLHTGTSPNYNYDELQQRIYQMEVEKENLILQVNVLTEQVEAQNEKIHELEVTLKNSKDQLNHSEARLRQEVESRSSMEGSKLDLMTQVSSLRLRLAAVERERQEFEDKSNKLESELVLTCACLAEKEADLATLKSKLIRNGKPSSVIDHGSETQKLKNALSSVIAANDEKEKKIQELKTALNRYKKFQELVISSHGRRGNSDDSFNLDLISEVDGKLDSFSESRWTSDKPPPAPRLHPQPLATSSPAHNHVHESSHVDVDSLRCSPIWDVSSNSLPVNFSSSLSQRACSSDNVSPPALKTPPVKRHYGTIPRQHGADVLLQIHQQLQQHKLEPSSTHSSLNRNAGRFTKNKVSSQSSQNLNHPGLENFRPSRSKGFGFSFGKGFFRLRSGKRSTSAPELALHEVGPLEDDNGQCLFPGNRRSSSPMSVLNAKQKPKGIKKIFGKLKRTGSENLDTHAAEFKRGGIRSTAGPRLGWPQSTRNFNDLNIPFAQWDSLMICDWFQCIGLGMYADECKKTIKSGDQLLRATHSDFEKMLGMKNPLHRKKLVLAINGAKSNGSQKLEPYQLIDYHWSIRWLDDIGLPQYKDAFFDARIDGSGLHHLTIEDLFHLKVTNQLHHLSMKWGIYVLRKNNFDTQCLKRRFLPGDEQTPLEVTKWTNHRVMEWLRTVDLSEYAPNLRGSGVHGSLMVYEPRFNADLMASLLNIPPNKTLLRRHLCTQFKQLVGSELMQKKRECEAQTNYTPLSPSAKVKVVRRSHISLMRKRNKGDMEFEDYICPMDLTDSYLITNSLSTKKDHVNEEQQKEEEAKRFLLKEESTLPSSVPEETSNDIKSISNLFQDEKAFEKLASTNV